MLAGQVSRVKVALVMANITSLQTGERTHYITGSGYNIGPVRYVTDLRGRPVGVQDGTLAECVAKLRREGFERVTVKQHLAEFPQSCYRRTGARFFRRAVMATRNYPAYVATKVVYAK